MNLVLVVEEVPVGVAVGGGEERLGGKLAWKEPEHHAEAEMKRETVYLTRPKWPVACTIKAYDCKFTIVNYASVCSIAYDRNLRS